MVAKSLHLIIIHFQSNFVIYGLFSVELSEYTFKARRRNIDYFMVGERVRFLFTSCEESQTNERVVEQVSWRFFTISE